jgi:hypothetical protein
MLSEAFKQLEAEPKNVGLTINESKTKYMTNSRNKVRFRNVRSLNLGSYKFERVEKLKYLGSLVTENSEHSKEIKIRIAAGNRCYFCLIKLLKSRAVASNKRVRMYRIVIRLVVTYGSETWCLTANDERSLRTWERKVLTKIYGPVYGNGIWRIRTNKKQIALYQELDIVAEIKKVRLRWWVHIERMSEDRIIKKKLYMSKPEGRRSVGRPKMRWLDDVEEDLRKMRISGWRGKARRRDKWKSVCLEGGQGSSRTVAP